MEPRRRLLDLPDSVLHGVVFGHLVARDTAALDACSRAAAGALERARTRDKVSGLLGPVHQEHVASLQRSSGSAAPSSPALARATLERRRASDEPRRSLRARPARDDAGGVALHLGRPLSEYTAKYRFRLRQLEQNIRGF